MYHSLIESLLPRRCAYCKTAISTGVFCPACGTLFAFAAPELKSTSPVSAAFVYGGVLREMLLKAKFQNSTQTSRLLIRHFRFCIEHELLTLPLLQCHYDSVTYVPTHWLRRLKRTHDFPALFARALSSYLRVPFSTHLVCTRLDGALSSLKSAELRQSAVIGRYQMARVRSSGARVLLVDDVTTTGTTLHTCANLLEQHGHRVTTFAFARTPLIHSDAEKAGKPFLSK
jgi:ComF family protein